MKVYVSGKITGTTDYKERFETAENILRAGFGYDVINPAQVCAGLPEGMTHDEYMAVCLCLVNMCDAIYMMEGWRESNGASIEYGYALAKELRIIEV